MIHIEQLLKGVLLNDGEIVKRTWQIENETNYVTETNRGNRKKKSPSSAELQTDEARVQRPYCCCSIQNSFPIDYIIVFSYFLIFLSDSRLFFFPLSVFHNFLCFFSPLSSPLPLLQNGNCQVDQRYTNKDSSLTI